MNKYMLPFLLVWLVMASKVQSQKKIAISDSLISNSDELPVKMGTQWYGKIWKFKFGDYAVASSKMGWLISSSKGGVFNRRTESKSTQKFSFVLSGPGTDLANVNAATNIETSALREIVLSPHFSIGSNEVLKESQNFSAFITINGDTTDTWALLMNSLQGTEVAENSKTVNLLTNGQRKIFIEPVTSNKKGEDNRKIPAMGYELMEDGQSIAALQFYGGGMLGANKNIIWLQRIPESKFRLMIAAALTAVLQYKANAQDF